MPPPECLEGPKTTKNPMECCKVQVVPKDIVDKCKAAHPRPPPGPPTGCCMSECVLNETQILKNGEIDKNAVVTHLTKELGGDDEAKKIANSVVDVCMKKADEMKDEFDKMAKMTPPGSQVCNMKSGFLIGCAHAGVYKECPSSKYTADAECDKIKTFLDKCMILLPPK